MSTIRSPGSAPITHVELEPTGPRRTPPPAGRQFRDSLDAGAKALLQGVDGASQLVPGGPVVSAAVRGLRAAAAGGGATPEAPGGDANPAGPSLEATLAEHSQDTMRYLELQQRMASENRRYTALSNVMKARHETAKSAINNIR